MDIFGMLAWSSPRAKKNKKSADCMLASNFFFIAFPYWRKLTNVCGMLGAQVLTWCDEYGAHFVGYFSKEKHSVMQYNLSCILTMPHRSVHLDSVVQYNLSCILTMPHSYVHLDLIMPPYVLYGQIIH